MTKTILFTFHDIGLGGVQKKIADVVESLSKLNGFGQKQYRIIVILENEKNFDLDEDMFLPSIKPFADVFYYRSKSDVDYKFFRVPFSLFLIWKMFVFRPDIIVPFMEPYAVPSIIGKLLLWSMGIKTKVVVCFDNVATFLLEHEYGSNWRHIYWKFLIKSTFRFANKVIMPSDFSKKDIINNFGVSENKVFVNKNWVSRTVIKHKRKSVKYDVLYVGRIDKVKNLKLFVDVVSTVRKKHNDLKVCIVGWGEEIQSLFNYIKAKNLQNNIELAGSQVNTDNYYLSSKVFLITSRFEGLPIVILESMALGTPVVSLNFPGSEEIINNGINGYVCKTKKCLSENVLRLIGDAKRRSVVGRASQETVRSKHGSSTLNNFVSLILD